jgi:NTP pyrophosphatase (non-canonical NTP hydrolase)
VITISETQRAVHATAKEKGWWDKPRTTGEAFCLMHSEISEALEELRAGRGLAEVYFVDGKPEGIPVELADVVIRVMDFCEHEGIDLATVIMLKHQYNTTRPYRHGGKKL